MIWIVNQLAGFFMVQVFTEGIWEKIAILKQIIGK